jgi:hypothetical protein
MKKAKKYTKVKKFLNFAKKFVNDLLLRLKSFVLIIVKFIVNIDISFLFIFAATYLFDFSYPWQYRLIGSFGLYYVYSFIVNNVKEICKILRS